MIIVTFLPSSILPFKSIMFNFKKKQIVQSVQLCREKLTLTPGLGKFKCIHYRKKTHL